MFIYFYIYLFPQLCISIFIYSCVSFLGLHRIFMLPAHTRANHDHVCGHWNKHKVRCSCCFCLRSLGTFANKSNYISWTGLTGQLSVTELNDISVIQAKVSWILDGDRERWLIRDGNTLEGVLTQTRTHTPQWWSIVICACVASGHCHTNVDAFNNFSSSSIICIHTFRAECLYSTVSNVYSLPHVNGFMGYWCPYVLFKCEVQTVCIFEKVNEKNSEFTALVLCSLPLNLSVSLPPAILVYRLFRNEPKRNVKLLHAIIHLLALIMSIVGEKERDNKEVNTAGCVR